MSRETPPPPEVAGMASKLSEQNFLFGLEKKMAGFRESYRAETPPDPDQVAADVTQLLKDIERVEPTDQRTPFAQYQRYLTHIDKDEIELLFTAHALYPERQDSFTHYLFTVNPMVGLSTEHAYQALKEDNSDFFEKRPVKEWFIKAVETARETYQQIEAFFSRWTNQALKEEKIAVEFLNAWKRDIQLILGETINLSTAMAIHTQEENCAMFTASTPFDFPSSRYSTDAIEQKKDSLGKLRKETNLYSDYYNYLADPNRMTYKHKDGVLIYVPTPVHLYDIQNFLRYFNQYWQKLSATFKPPLSIEAIADQETRLGIGKFGSILLRSGGVAGQPRVVIKPNITPYDGFNLRIDKEAHLLTFDVAGVDFDTAFEYASTVARESEGRRIAPDYTTWIDETGAIRKRKPKKPNYLPSIMRPGVEAGPGALAERAAIFTATTAYLGETIGMRSQGSFSYHLRENVTNSQPFFDNFGKIIDDLKSMLSRSK